MAPVGILHADRAIRLGGATKKHLQDRGDGVKSMPGSRGAGIQGLHTADDRGRTEFQGEIVGTGALPGVQE